MATKPGLKEEENKQFSAVECCVSVEIARWTSERNNILDI